MKKLNGMVIVLLSVIVTGCSNINSEQREDSSIQSEEQYADNENDSISYDEYSGYWSYEGKTHEQILAEGGIELSCSITEDNQFSGTLFSQQEITQRFASIEDISGKIEQAELYFDYADDEWGNSGTLHIQFLSDSIYVEVLNNKKAENGSDYGINGSFEFIILAAITILFLKVKNCWWMVGIIFLIVRLKLLRFYVCCGKVY